MGKYVLYPTVVEPARSAKRFSRGNNFKGTGVFSFKMYLLRHFGFFSAALRLFVWLGSVYRLQFSLFRKNVRVRIKSGFGHKIIFSISWQWLGLRTAS